MKFRTPIRAAADALASAIGAKAPASADPIKLWELRWQESA